MKYPDTRSDVAEDILAGVSFSDPYHWLEQRTDEVRQWQRAQAELASAHVREWPPFERLHELVARFNTERFVSLPRYCAGKWFRTQMAPGASQARVLISDEPMGEGRVLFDPLTEDPKRPPFLSWIAPSPDGRTLALGLCADGSENNTIRLIDVASGRQLADPPTQTLMDAYTGGVQWLRDSSGFFFSAIAGSAVEFEQRVYWHLRSPPSTVPVEVPWIGKREYRFVVVSRDGRYAVAVERLMNPVPIAIAPLGSGPLRWRPFVTAIAGTLAGQVVGDRYIAVTDIGAPRGRVIAIPLDAADPNDPQGWEELVGESDATLRSVTPIGQALYLTEYVDTYARVRVVDLNGKPLGAIPLPARGAIVLEAMPSPICDLIPREHPRTFVFGFSSLTASPGIYSHTLGREGIVVLKAPEVRLADAVTEDRWAVSKDGTRIPYHIVRLGGVAAGSPKPTLIYAYGGFNILLAPQFPGPMAALIAAGGVFVHAHLRGGAEFGLEWWQGGRMRNKQNCYEDLYAVAEDLIANKVCTPKTLAVTGLSNGGLLAGVAVTQRPDLWAAVIPRVPLLDLIGACRDPYGRMGVLQEFANVEDAEEVRRLASFSPYHLIRAGVTYPAVFLDVGDTDPRCPPWHARKFAARLQRANQGDAPILLRVWENVGHGRATDKRLAALEHAEWLAFTLRHLGVKDWA